MTNQVVLLSRPINFAVVQLPERRFPGVVFQGDTLHSLVRQVEEVARLLKAGELDDAVVGIVNMKEQLSDALTHYEKICAEKKIVLPYHQ